jgi:hypothetical protein
MLGHYFCAVGIEYYHVVLFLQVRPVEPVACRQHFASGDISNEKMFFNSFHGKVEIEHQGETYITLLIHFIRMC